MLLGQAMLNDGLSYSEMMDIKNKVKETLIKEMNNDKELEKKSEYEYNWQYDYIWK